MQQAGHDPGSDAHVRHGGYWGLSDGEHVHSVEQPENPKDADDANEPQNLLSFRAQHPRVV